MAAIQLNFTLRTSANCKTVHLIGSWDGYKGQYPLNKDPTKSGGWKGTFRFQGSQLKQGSRYWYYYAIDGYHLSHDPARESVVEPTTGRKLNVLDIPTAKPPDPGKAKSSKRNSTSSGHSRRNSAQVPKGRSLSPSQIQSPLPGRPHATQRVVQERFTNPTVEVLSARLAATEISDSESDSEESESESGSDSGGSEVPSLTNSRTSHNSSPSSVSSVSSCCTCERYGITRTGERVKLDCKGARCGSSDGSECSSESEHEYRTQTTRRQGIMVRK